MRVSTEGNLVMMMIMIRMMMIRVVMMPNLSTIMFCFVYLEQKHFPPFVSCELVSVANRSRSRVN